MLTRGVAARYVLPVALLGLLGYAWGPTLDYYLHLVGGQLRLIFTSQPISELLSDPDLDPVQKARLNFVAEVRDFGQQRLGLDVGDQYTSFYDTGKRPVSWNLGASAPDRFEPYIWTFPIVGAVPYKGFFELARAQEEEERLESSGYDVWLSHVSAYSTLGFFADPVLGNMLDYTDDALATLLLHELTHSTVFAPSHTDFNESLATFVGKTGSLALLTERHGASSPQVDEARQHRKDGQAFRGFVRQLVSDLDSLYNSGLGREQILAERVSVFETAKVEFRAVRETLLQFPSRYDGFLEWKINNARLLSYRRYHDLEDFEVLLSACDGDLRRLIGISHACAQAVSPRSCLRDTTAVKN